MPRFYAIKKEPTIISIEKKVVAQPTRFGCGEAFYAVKFSDGAEERTAACSCGCGCGNSFPMNDISIGMSRETFFSEIEDFSLYLMYRRKCEAENE